MMPSPLSLDPAERLAAQHAVQPGDVGIPADELATPEPARPPADQAAKWPLDWVPKSANLMVEPDSLGVPGERLPRSLDRPIRPRRIDHFAPCAEFAAKFPKEARSLSDAVGVALVWNMRLELVRRDERNAKSLFRGWAEGRGLPSGPRGWSLVAPWARRDSELRALDPMDGSNWDFLERCFLVDQAEQIVAGTGPYADAQLFTRPDTDGNEVVAMISHPLRVSLEQRNTLEWVARVCDLDLEIRPAASWFRPGKAYRVMLAVPGLQMEFDDEVRITDIYGEAIRDGGRWPLNPY